MRHFSKRLSLVLLAVLALSPGCTAKPEPKAAPLTITICHGSVTDILPRIALEQGYFTEEGLAVTLKDLSDGHLAFDELLRGECNFAITGAPPIVLVDPQKVKFAILATVMADDNSAKIIARRDHGIVTPQDLKGKRIGVKKGIIGHLFLDLFMMKYRLNPGEVEQVFMAPDKFQAALAAGEIDGFAMTNKIINAAARALGKEATIFAEPGLNVIHGILTTRPELPLNLKATPPLLKALLRAEEFTRRDPAAAKKLVAKAYNLTAAEIGDIWSRTTIEVALANSIFAHLEEHYKWQVERELAPAAPTFPNYLHAVLPAYLRALKPQAVSVNPN